MQIGMIGLGRMGANIVRRLMRYGHDCVVDNRTPKKLAQLKAERAIGAFSAAIKSVVPADIPPADLFKRFCSCQDHSFADKMRYKFGGHVKQGGTL